MKQLLSLLSFLVVLALVLTACGAPAAVPTSTPLDEPTAEAAAAPTEEATEAPTEEATEAPTEEATTSPAGGFSGTIKIASQSPLSGGQAAIGTGLRNGAELALNQLGSTITDLGFELELADFDDEALPERGVANANNVVADTDILCVVGHLNSGVSLAALPTYQEASVVMISPSNTTPDISEDFENAFRVVGRDDVQGAVAEQFARETLNATSVYILHDQTDYGQGVASFFQQNAEANGLNVLGFEGTQERANFDSILTPISGANPDLIYFGGVYDQAGPFFRQARDRGIQAQLMGPDAMDNSELVQLAGDAVDGMYYTSVAAPVSQFPDAAQYAQDYETEYGDSAPPFSAQAYDAMGICIQAIADAAQAAGGKPTRAQVLEAMGNLQPYQGITGAYAFNENGDPVEAVYYVLQVNVEDWNANELVDRLNIAPPGSQAATTAPTAATTETTPTAASDGTTEAIGQGETIKIATQSPLSGAQAALGVGIRNGAELGIEQLGEQLTTLGFTVELADFDDEAQPDKGVANANNIAADTDILCVNGHFNSGVALAALPTYQNADLGMVSPANTNPGITDAFENSFRIVGRDDVQGVVGEQFARETLNATSVYIIHDQTDYGQGIANFFQESAEANGVNVLGFEGTQERAVFDSILTPISGANPDLIYFGGIYDQAGPLFRQARDRGIPSMLMGPDGLDNEILSELAGDAVEGMHYTSVAAPVSQFPDAAQFAEDYQARYNEPAPPFSAQAYDVAGICIQAIADAAQAAGGKPTRAQVLEALRNLQPYTGITGAYTFNANGDPVEAVYYVLKVNVTDWNSNEVVERLTIAPPEPGN